MARTPGSYGRFLAPELVAAGQRVAIVDADIGQKNVDPPATVTLAHIAGTVESWAAAPEVTRCPTSFLRAMISERIACASNDFTCTGLKKPVRARCVQMRPSRAHSYDGLVARQGLQRLMGLPALDTDSRHTPFA